MVSCKFCLLINSQTSYRIPVYQLLISEYTYSGQWLYTDLQSYFNSFPCSERIIHFSRFHCWNLVRVLLGFHSHLSLNGHLQVNFQNIIWRVYLHSWLLFLSAYYPSAYLVSCKYFFCELYHTEKLGRWVLELDYLTSNPSFAIYRFMILYKKFKLVYSSEMCENNKNCLIWMLWGLIG